MRFPAGFLAPPKHHQFGQQAARRRDSVEYSQRQSQQGLAGAGVGKHARHGVGQADREAPVQLACTAELGQLGRRCALRQQFWLREVWDLGDNKLFSASVLPAIVVARVIEGEGAFGYNAATDQYGDMVEMGVIDPTKVTRLGLQNAASIASLILTTDCVIVERPAPSPTVHDSNADA